MESSNSQSDWGNVQQQSDNGQHSGPNKNMSKGRNKNNHNQWKPRPQGLFGDGDGNKPTSFRHGRYSEESEFNPTISVTSPTTSSSGSSSSPSTVVSQSPNKSDSSSTELDLTNSVFCPSADAKNLVSSNAVAGEHDEAFDNFDLLGDSNGNPAQFNTTSINGDNLNEHQVETTVSPDFESASENEDFDLDAKDQTQGLASENERADASILAGPAENSLVKIVDSEDEISSSILINGGNRKGLSIPLTDTKSGSGSSDEEYLDSTSIIISKDPVQDNSVPEISDLVVPLSGCEVNAVSLDNVQAVREAKPAINSSVEVVDLENEDDSSDCEEEAAITHASLVVNLSDSSNSGINFLSFTTSSLNDSPLSSSRSAPPDISSVPDREEVILEEFTLPPLQVSIPIINKDALELDDEIQLSASDRENIPSTSKEQNYIARKKNSVSFAANTIDIDEVILARPSIANSSSSKSGVSPSILINGSNGCGLSVQPTNWTVDLGSGSSDDEDEDSGSTITSSDLVQLQVSKGNVASGIVDLVIPPSGGEVDDLAADEEVQEINAAMELPITTTELTASNGVKVYVVGTAHFSVKSQQDVIETIQKVQPNVLLLELCQSRRNILTLDEETILREASDLNFEKVRLAIRQSGTVQGLLHLLLLSMSAQITKKLGMAPGGEFRVALHEANKLNNCIIFLGDRPFGITLSRALAALTLKQKFKLCWQFFWNNEDITKEEIERCKEKDLLEKMLIEMMGEYPSISQVFVHERDLYLAHSLWGAALSSEAAISRNRAHGIISDHIHGTGTTGTVVGIVGMGHVAGIIKHWGKTTEEQINEIMLVPEPSLQSIILRKAFKVTFYIVLGYGTYKLSRKMFNFPSDALMSRAIKQVPELIMQPSAMFKK